MVTYNPKGFAELHSHIGSSIPPHVYWHIAKSEGYKLDQKDYLDFVNQIVLSPTRKMSLKKYLDEIYHPILDKLSSGTRALEKAVYETLGGAYRNGITLYELRGNPMKHNKEGEVDLDSAIMAMLRGMEQALLEYSKLQAGLIFCLDRQFTYEQNKIIVEKAIKYHRRGVIGIDFSNYNSDNFSFKNYIDPVKLARKNGLKITAHTGETDDTNDMWDCIKYIQPDRIGHGIRAAFDKELMKTLAKMGTHLEVCPLSNLMTKAVKDEEELAWVLRTLFDNGVNFSINTDWPETIEGAQLVNQYQYVLDKKIFSVCEIEQLVKWSFEATFIPISKNNNLYL